VRLPDRGGGVRGRGARRAARHPAGQAGAGGGQAPAHRGQRLRPSRRR
ncbi:MAG: UDP-galactopyranose mutase, partial [uncultured Thermomicrobiales bacterium]